MFLVGSAAGLVRMQPPPTTSQLPPSFPKDYRPVSARVIHIEDWERAKPSSIPLVVPHGGAAAGVNGREAPSAPAPAAARSSAPPLAPTPKPRGSLPHGGGGAAAGTAGGNGPPSDASGGGAVPPSPASHAMFGRSHYASVPADIVAEAAARATTASQANNQYGRGQAASASLQDILGSVSIPMPEIKDLLNPHVVLLVWGEGVQGESVGGLG